MWQAHLKTASYAESRNSHRKSSKMAVRLPFVTRDNSVYPIETSYTCIIGFVLAAAVRTVEKFIRLPKLMYITMHLNNINAICENS